MGKKIIISVVIPAYNEEKYLPSCLSCLKKQKFDRPYEVIVVVAKLSKDKTLQIAKDFGTKVIIDKNLGLPGARQKGLLKTRGEIVVGTDADSLYPPDWLSRIYSNFQQNEKIVAVCGPGVHEKKPLWAFVLWRFVWKLVELYFRLTGRVFYAPGFNLAFKRKAFLAIGGYNTNLAFGGEEFDTLQRLKRLGKVVFDRNLKVKTSSRRFRVGLFPFIFKHVLFYYWTSFFLSKIFKKRIIQAKAVR